MGAAVLRNGMVLLLDTFHKYNVKLIDNYMSIYRRSIYIYKYSCNGL